MIRPYQADDTDAIIRVWRRASDVAHPFLAEEFLAQETENIRTLYLPNAETWVLERDGAVIGFMALIGREVGAIFVDPAFHGRGYGKALMDKAVELRGHLELDVFKANDIGRRFYARYGFQGTEERMHEASGFPVIRLTYAP